MTNMPKIKQPLQLALLIVLGAVVVCAALYTLPSVRQAVAQATTRQPEPYTEIFFTSPNQLAKTFVSNTQQTIHFTIHNQEGHQVVYPYVIYLDKTLAGFGTVTLDNNESLLVSKKITMKSAQTRSEITVTLLTDHQSIHYWTEKAQ